MASLKVAKSRLEPVFSREFLQDLVFAMLEDVVVAAIHSRAFDDIFIFSPDKSLQRFANQWNISFQQETRPSKHFTTCLEALTQVALKDYDAGVLLTCFSDVPLLLPEDFTGIVALAEESGVVAAPSVGGGCNFFLRTPPDVIPIAFEAHTRPSFLSFTQTAAERGIPVKVYNSIRSLWDFDLPEDVVIGTQILALNKPSSPTLHLLRPVLDRLELVREGNSRKVKVTGKF